jgi:superfamily II DNA/RNA helicase
VIHVDPPMEHKAYLHRSGRTARAGAQGDVITVSLPTQRKDLSDLLKKAGIAVTPLNVTASSPQVVKLIGEVAPYVKPSAEQPQQHTGTSNGRNAQRKRAARTGNTPAGRTHGSQPGRSTRTSQPSRDTGARPATNNRRAQQRSR